MTDKRYVIRFTGRLRMQDLVSYGAGNNSVLDWICAFLLSICPILQHYRGLVVNAGFTVLVLMAPYLAIKVLGKLLYGRFNISCMSVIMFLIMFQAYKIVAHEIGVSKTLHSVFVMFFFLAVASGCVNVRKFAQITAYIACVAGALLVVQYICHYVLGFHLQMVPTNLLLPESRAWIAGAKTGMVNITGGANRFYRPSAFFLEPSHLFIYSFPSLAIMLLSPDMKRWRIKGAILVSIGMIFSTSGMGVGVAVGIWLLYFAFYNGGRDKRNVARLANLFTQRNLILLALGLIAVVVMYNTVGFFRSTVNRVFDFSGGESVAISGRTRLVTQLIGGMDKHSLIFGLTDDVSNLDFNRPGFYATLYKFGFIGVFFSYGVYAPGLFRLKGQYFWISFIIILISFFVAHTHGTFYMLFYVIYLMDGYSKSGKPAKKKRKAAPAPIR